MRQEQTVVFIHGLGETPDDWACQLATLPEGFRGLTVAIPGLGPDDAETEFSLAEAAAGILAALEGRGVEQAHVVGLSLGAMIAFQFAVDRPERVRSLVLAAGQVKPPRVLMALQHAVMRVLPARLVAQGGASKAQMLSVLRAVASTDFDAHLKTIGAPTLVLCGSKDRANLPAARRFAEGIPGAELRVIEGAGHQLQLHRPEAFSRALGEFLAG